MIDDFQKWVREQNDFFSERGLRIAVEEAPEHVANPSIRVDFDSDDTIGRITVWSSGDCTMEIIDVTSEAPLMNKHIQLDSDSSLDAAFSEFFDLL